MVNGWCNNRPFQKERGGGFSICIYRKLLLLS